jgi:hypothetical protein
LTGFFSLAISGNFFRPILADGVERKFRSGPERTWADVCAAGDGGTDAISKPSAPAPFTLIYQWFSLFFQIGLKDSDRIHLWFNKNVHHHLRL